MPSARPGSPRRGKLHFSSDVPTCPATFLACTETHVFTPDIAATSRLLVSEHRRDPRCKGEAPALVSLPSLGRRTFTGQQTSYPALTGRDGIHQAKRRPPRTAYGTSSSSLGPWAALDLVGVARSARAVPGPERPSRSRSRSPAHIPGGHGREPRYRRPRGA
jgi:hypothetical protein